MGYPSDKNRDCFRKANNKTTDFKKLEADIVKVFTKYIKGEYQGEIVDLYREIIKWIWVARDTQCPMQSDCRKLEEIPNITYLKIL